MLLKLVVESFIRTNYLKLKILNCHYVSYFCEIQIKHKDEGFIY